MYILNYLRACGDFHADRATAGGRDKTNNNMNVKFERKMSVYAKHAQQIEYSLEQRDSRQKWSFSRFNQMNRRAEKGRGASLNMRIQPAELAFFCSCLDLEKCQATQRRDGETWSNFNSRKRWKK